jgi:hypothetical protein
MEGWPLPSGLISEISGTPFTKEYFLCNLMEGWPLPFGLISEISGRPFTIIMNVR